jgi:hypothetical protein
MQWLTDGKTLQRVSTYLPAQFEVVDPSLQPRFPRNTIFDDVSEAIAKVSVQAADPSAAHPDRLCLQSVVCESCLAADRGVLHCYSTAVTPTPCDAGHPAAPQVSEPDDFSR